MIKRLLCLTLVAVLLTGSMLLFAGCSGDDSDQITKEAERDTMTLNMYLMAKEGTTEESVDIVEAAINKITKSKFKTQINLYVYEEEDYYDAIEQRFKNKEYEAELAKEADKALRKYLKENKDANAKQRFYEENPQYAKYAETTTDMFAESTAEQTYYNEDTGILELKYPDADPNAVDIFFIGGYDRLLEYIENEWVSRIDDELTSGSKKLKDYISSIYLDSVKIDSATYAIPNNRTIGEYTYMLVNKELLKKYYYNIEDIRSLPDCSEFLFDIAKHEPDIIPIDGSPELFNVLYWSINPDTFELERDKFSVIGRTYTATSTYGTPLLFTSIFSLSVYRDQLLANKLYEDNGYFRSNVPAGAKCAVKIVRGGAELKDIYGDEYEMVMLESPRAYQEDIFESMFAVGGYADSKTLPRAMEIITYINTNTDFRNILAYGVEGVHYNLDENGQVVRVANNGYYMDFYKTGNAFIATTEKGMDPNIWEYGKQQNRDATVDMLLGFTFVGEKLNVSAIKAIEALSDSVKARIDACKNYAELKALTDSLVNELRSTSNNDIKNYTNSQADANEAGEAMPYVVFYEWLNSKGFISND